MSSSLCDVAVKNLMFVTTAHFDSYLSRCPLFSLSLSLSLFILSQLHTHFIKNHTLSHRYSPPFLPANRYVRCLTHYRGLLSEDDESEGALLREMSLAGVDEAALPQVRQQLKDYLERHRLEVATLNTGSGSGGSSFDMAALDSILKDSFLDDEDDDLQRAAGEKQEAPGEGEDSDSDSDSDSDGEEGKEAHQILSEEEWAEVVAKYKRPAITELEHDRDKVYALAEYNLLERAESVDDLETFQTVRYSTGCNQ